MSRVRDLVLFVSLVALVGMFGMAGTANAHFVTFGWNDNGDGTVTLFGEHWHGDVTAPYSDNGGLTISDIDPAGGISPPFTVQWTGFILNTDVTTLLGNGTLDGSAGTGNCCSGDYDDWFFTAPLVLGNGTWQFFTGTNCCIDTMATPVNVTLTGITSVPPGTGPGDPVPEPSTVLLMGSGLAGLAALRRRSGQAKRNQSAV